jgi:hypothetical protein
VETRDRKAGKYSYMEQEVSVQKLRAGNKHKETGSRDRQARKKRQTEQEVETVRPGNRDKQHRK